MLFTKKTKKYDIKEEVLEALDGQKILVIGTGERTILNGQEGEIAETIINILENLRGCTDKEFVDHVIDVYKMQHLEDYVDDLISDFKKTVEECKHSKKEDTPAPKKRGRKPKEEKKEEK